MIGLIDYGLGNISAFENIYRNLGIKTVRVNRPAINSQISGYILPGVGSFDNCMERITCLHFDEFIRELWVSGVPVLGVCVGMQILFDWSEEGQNMGLGLIPGQVKLLPQKIRPHLGWNSLNNANCALYNKDHKQRFYFIHSYHCVPNDESYVTSRVEYFEDSIVASVRLGSFYGTQFHPEKSHISGVNLLDNFSRICNAGK